MLLIAPTVAAVCALIGLYSSYYLDTASGPMVVLANGLAFALAYVFGPRHGVLVSRGLLRRRGRVAERSTE
jgi:manganese transport system permease protein